MSIKKVLVRSAGTIALFTLFSRVLGMFRDVRGAHIFGAGWQWDAFAFAWMLPNMFRHLFGEGALSSAFVPVFSDYIVNKPKEEAWKLASIVATLLAVVLLGIVVVGELVSIPVEMMFEDSDAISLQFVLIRILFPYVALICFVAFLMGMLNSLNHFAAPALAPVVLNLFWLSAVFFVVPFGAPISTQVTVLAVMLLLGGVAQLLMQLPPLWARGVRLRPCFEFRHPGLKRIFTLIVPMLIGLAPMQINILLDNFIARVMGSVGAISVFYYSNRLMQFPLAVIGIAMGTAVFPLLARFSAANHKHKLAAAISRSLRLTLFMALPASVGLVVLARPVIELFFAHGLFDASAVGRTVFALVFYAAGVWVFCSLQIITRYFYALQDTKTPVKIAAAMVGLNLALNLLLVGPMGAAGLALATTIAQTANLVALVWILHRRGERLLSRSLLVYFGKVAAIALLLMGGVCLATLRLVEGSAALVAAGDAVADAINAVVVLLGGGAVAGLGKLATDALTVFVPVAVSVATYLAASHFLHLKESGIILGAVFSRKK